MFFVTLIAKVIIVCIFAIIIRGTLPRYRIDQITQINWKHFIFVLFGFLLTNYTYIYIF